MLRFLFPRLTVAPARGAALFGALVAEARRKAWFVEGGVEDSVDGRFAVLATVTALATVRLERGDETRGEAVALTERFIEAMDAEHRQMGLGDPGLGKTVRKLVSSLSRRVDLWRSAVAGELTWEAATSDSLFRDDPPSAPALQRCCEMARELWERLESASDRSMNEGGLQ